MGWKRLKLVAFTTAKNTSWIYVIHIAVKPFTVLNTFNPLLKNKKN